MKKLLKYKAGSKLRDREGMTIVEILMAIIVLLLVTAMVTTAIDLGIKHYRRSTMRSEARVLNATLIKAVQDELRYAEEISSPAGSGIGGFKYKSKSRVMNNEVYFDYGSGGELLLKKVSDGSGVGLVSSKSYVFDIKPELTISWSESDRLFSCELKIKEDAGAELVSSTFGVKPLNG